MAKRDVISGMARALWAAASGARHASGPPTPAAIKAAKDLAQLYEEANGGSLVGLNYFGDDDDDFGRRLAVAALHLGGANPTAHLPDGVSVPIFSVKLVGSDLVWDGGWRTGGERSNPRKPHDVPHTKTVAETRAILAKIPKKERCDAGCPGWIVAETNTDRGDEIEVCDECMQALPKAIRLSDDDVAQLPEAQSELAGTGSDPRYNPPKVVQWYRVTWPDDSGVYPAGDALDAQLRYLRSQGIEQDEIAVRLVSSTTKRDDQDEDEGSSDAGERVNPPSTLKAKRAASFRDDGLYDVFDASGTKVAMMFRSPDDREWYEENLPGKPQTHYTERWRGSSQAEALESLERRLGAAKTNPGHKKCNPAWKLDDRLICPKCGKHNALTAQAHRQYLCRDCGFRCDKSGTPARTGCDSFEPCHGNYACKIHAASTPGTMEHAIGRKKNPSTPTHGSNKVYDYVRQVTAEGAAASVDGITRSVRIQRHMVKTELGELERTGMVKESDGFYTAAGVKPGDWYR